MKKLTPIEKRAAWATHNEFCRNGLTAPRHCYVCDCLGGDCPCHEPTSKQEAK